MGEIIERNDENTEEFYIDARGYKRYKKDNRLIHRDIAFKEVYCKNRASFPRKFSEYIVHHIDGNKLNNKPSNLSIKPKETHNLVHEIKKKEEKLNMMEESSNEHEQEARSIEVKKELLRDKTVSDVFF